MTHLYMKGVWLGLIGTVLLLTACGGGGGGGGGGGNADPNEVLTSNISFSNGTVVNGKPPEPTFNADDPVVQQSSGTSTVEPGSSSSLSVSVSQIPPNQDVQVNVQFGSSTNSYVQIPVAASVFGGQTSGTLNLPFSVPAGICDNVDDIQHQIDCFEQVQLPDGSKVSSQTAQQMLLACGTSDSGGFNTASAFCAEDYPGEACDILAGQQGGGDWEFAQGQTCASAYPNAQLLGDYGCSDSSTFNSCGACAVASLTAQKTKALSTKGNVTLEEILYDQMVEYASDPEARKRITFTPDPAN